jgi:hypothetical protein
MMFLLNELSIHNQFQSEADFLTSLKIVLKCRDVLRRYQRSLHCSRGTLGNRQVVRNNPFRKVVGNIANKDIQRAVLLWIDRDGPFWDDDKLHSPDELFSEDTKGDVVTDTVLAEAAFMIYQKMDASVVSFSPSDYLYSPVVVRWHRNPDDVFDISVANHWETLLVSDLLAALEPPIQSWGQLVEYVELHYENIVFLPSFASDLKGQPFSHTIAEHALFLLKVIDELKTCFDVSGHRTKKGNEIIESYFTGDHAMFSDESPTNKIAFRKDLTFKKDDETEVFCSFHGKISHKYYRLHMSWPVTKNDPLYVAYLGPKITKA